MGEPVRSPPLAPENPLTFNVSPPCPPRVQLSQQGPLSLHQSKESLLYELQSQVWETSPEARQASNWGGGRVWGGLFFYEVKASKMRLGHAHRGPYGFNATGAPTRPPQHKGPQEPEREEGAGGGERGGTPF